jgi:dipeptidyl aminopeptidase/acylaminoacyl peptidase
MKYRLLPFFLFLFPLLAAAQVQPGDNLEVSGIPDIPEELVERTRQYQNARSASLLDWDASGEGLYIRTRFGNTSQVHHVAAPGFARRQITFYDEPVSGMSVDRRNGRNGFTYTRDVGGGEFYQIYYFDLGSGRSTLLTDGHSRHSGAYWLKGGEVFAYSGNGRNGKDTDVYIMNPDQPEQARRLTERPGSWRPAAWSPDGKRLVVTQYISANKSQPWIVDIETKNMTPLFSERDGDVSYAGFVWSPDGTTIYFTADIDREFRTLFARDVSSGRVHCILPDARWDIGGIGISDDGRYMAYTMNEDGIGAIHIHQLPSMQTIDVDAVPAGIVSGLRFSPDSRKLAFNINGAATQGDVYVLTLDSGALDRWTVSEVGGLDLNRFVIPELIHYPTFDIVDGRQRHIPAFVSRPQAAEGKAPVIIDIHGGPEAQSRPSFSPIQQYWINELGCVVIQPNVRGSSGYGKTWLTLDNGYNREHAVRDIGALLDWIALQPDLDADRVAVYGGSYGGYMVLASMIMYPERIRCGVNVVGISNFVTFLENTQSYRRDLRRVEYGDERDPAMREYLIRISPTTNADRISAPLFVAQGENDPRVPASEARQIIEAVRKNNIPVWTLFARDEGHGFAKKNNRDYFTWAAILFFTEYLLR